MYSSHSGTPTLSVEAVSVLVASVFGESAGLVFVVVVVVEPLLVVVVVVVVVPPPQLVKKKSPQAIAAIRKSLIFSLFILFLAKKLFRKSGSSRPVFFDCKDHNGVFRGIHYLFG